MRKNYLKALLLGAVVTASAGTFVSCNYDDDIDELKNRITVVEGLIGELKTAIASGLSITSATQTDGVWTLVLSNGSNIVCGGKSGSTVTVTENADNFVISVEGKDYVLPKGAAAASLIYRPKFVDGKEMIADMKSIPVSFLISGDVFEDSKITEVAIVDAYALTTRAASSLFEVVEGSATVNENVVTVNIKAGESAEAGKTYNVNVRIKVGSKEYISNYFQIEMDNGFIYDNAAPQDQIDAFAAADGMNATVGEDGAAKLIIFNDELATMEGEVDFAKFFKGLPEGAKFIIGAQATEEGSKAFDALRNSMGADGKFSWKQRPGTAFPNGFRVTVQNKDGQTIGKADFKYSDPIASVDFVGIYAGKVGAHIEIRGGDKETCPFLNAGANDIDLAKDFTKAGDTEGYYSPMHDGGRFINELWRNFKVTYKETGDIIDFDGTRYVLGDAGKKFAAACKGIWWTSRQISLGSSNRRNDPNRPADEGSDDNVAYCGGNCNGELVWDGIPGEARTFFGVNLEENGHIVTTDKYLGWNMRVGIWINYEYLYGEKVLGGDALVWTWLNRRTCPLGLDDSVIQKAKDGEIAM